MNPDDPLLAVVAARNPVPDPDALTAEDRAMADALRQRVQDVAGPSRGPQVRLSAGWRRLLMGAAAVLPVAAVVLFAVGIRASRHPAPGSATAPPQTILVIASDHSGTAPYRTGNTDMIVLVRLNASSKTVNVLSVPRDLKVHLPNELAKLNAAYSEGGPKLLINVLRNQVFLGLSINHFLDVNFASFVDLVDAIGCVYTDVDHRYYNNAALTDYSSIDLQPGYQKLCGSDALAFVRFRHTDTDIVRNARQQDFLRWALQSYPVAKILSNLNHLMTVAGRHIQTDAELRSPSALKSLQTLIASTLGRPLKKVPFPAVLLPCGDDTRAPCYVTARPSAEAAAFQEFITPTSALPSTGPPASLGDESLRVPTSSLVADPADGQSQAAALGGAGLPVLYPDLIAAGSHYCSTTSGNCGEASPGNYLNVYPRKYDIEADGRAYPSYRMTLAIRPALDEYYGVQGTTWTNPPILDKPTRTQLVNGKKLLEFFNGQKLSLVAWKTANAAYWVSNTLTDSFTNRELIGIAASLRPAAPRAG